MEHRLEYVASGPVLDEFFWSDDFVTGIRGPVGSGKSTACVAKMVRKAVQQDKAPNGKRKTRWAVIRNTFPELKTTTIKTWHQWMPREIGSWREMGPPTHHVIVEELDMEVLFLALDRPEDIAKLLSLELTGAWINEAREVPKAVLDALTARVGRYPAAVDGGATWSGVLMDTNPPDTDHWWYRLAEEQTPEGFTFWSQPAGDEHGAENIDYLPAGYYDRIRAGKTEEWIKVYIRGDYGYVQDGRPVYPEFRDGLHTRAFELDRLRPISLGIDFGLTPAALIGQRNVSGQIRWRHELVTERMGARALGQELNRLLNGPLSGFEVGEVTGDPAGNAGSSVDEAETPFRVLKAAGIPAVPANTNDWEMRRESVAKPLSTIIDGEPGLILHPECVVTRKGMMGGYRFKRVQVPGDERYQDKPDKNRYSHVCEAGQYHNLGIGEGRSLLRRHPSRVPKSFVANVGRLM